MTMPTAEEHISLAEIVRTMKDFREEFRATVGTMMRADVYAAQQATLRAEIAAMEANFKADITALNSKCGTLQRAIDSYEAEKRQNRGLVLGAFGSAAVALILQLFNFKR